MKTAPPLSRRAAAPPADTAASAGWCVGVVTDALGRQLTVVTGGLQLRAQRALGCLLVPQPGDSVACLRAAPDALWIMSVLQREDCATPNLLQLQGDTRVQVDGGSLAFAASDELALQGRTMRVAASELSVAIDVGEVVGRQLRLSAGVLKLVGSVFSSVMDRVQHFSRHYLRSTDGLDRVSATHVECEASQLLRLSGEHTLVNGEKLIKARGGQIHFG